MSQFSVRNFCLTVPKTSVEESFFVLEVFWYQKKLGIREGEAITSFRQFFLSLGTESFRRGTMLCSTKYRITISFMSMRGILGFSKKNFVVSEYGKNFVGATFLCFTNFLVSKRSWIRWGEGTSITIFRQKILSHCVEKLHRGTF